MFGIWKAFKRILPDVSPWLCRVICSSSGDEIVCYKVCMLVLPNLPFAILVLLNKKKVFSLGNKAFKCFKTYILSRV